MRLELGRVQESLESDRLALALDPTSPGLTSNLGGTYHRLRDFTSAETFWRATIALLGPEGDPETYFRIAQIYAAWDGTTDRARAVMVESAAATRQDELAEAWAWLAILERDYHEALRQVSRHPASEVDTGDHEAAIDRIEDLLSRPG